jgi:hypothetical protein
VAWCSVHRRRRSEPIRRLAPLREALRGRSPRGRRASPSA